MLVFSNLFCNLTRKRRYVLLLLQNTFHFGRLFRHLVRNPIKNISKKDAHDGAPWSGGLHIGLRPKFFIPPFPYLFWQNTPVTAVLTMLSCQWRTRRPFEVSFMFGDILSIFYRVLCVFFISNWHVRSKILTDYYKGIFEKVE